MELKYVFGKTKKAQIITISFIILGIGLFIFNSFSFSSQPKVYSLLNVLAVLLILAPSLLVRYFEYRHERNLEERLPDFLRDVSEAIYSGMTLPQAIKHVMHNNYGNLSKYVKQIGIQIDWGVPFEKVFKEFGERTKNRVIKRAISTVIETHRAGGNIASTLSAVTQSLIEINKLQKERLAHIYQQIVTGYMIYFVFLGIMIGMLKFLLPGMITPPTTSVAGFATGTQEMAQIYKEMFQWLVVIEGIFSGLSIGKMSEGSIIAGLKHSLALASIGYTAFLIFG